MISADRVLAAGQPKSVNIVVVSFFGATTDGQQLFSHGRSWELLVSPTANGSGPWAESTSTGTKGGLLVRDHQSCADCDCEIVRVVRSSVSQLLFSSANEKPPVDFFIHASIGLSAPTTTLLISAADLSQLTTMTKSSPASSSKQSRLSKPSCSPAVAARRALLRRIQRQELRKLQLLIPSMSYRNYRREPDACTVIDQAIRYIDQLHATVVARVQAGSLPREVIDRLNLPAVARIRLAEQSSHRSQSVVRRDVKPW